eukprot:TRINITY_DN2832_c0_g1_i2.p1 TRINITY_DN2832_c0_g1~~TRINITY_DN2832_c0_g1_i2.p1  ORF type:complete len:237 (-),score=29.42 TRINITY_DN2832_c0_g1_i2:142-852(-)
MCIRDSSITIRKESLEEVKLSIPEASHSHLSESAQGNFKRLFDIHYDDPSTWESVLANETIKVWKKKIADSPVVLVKAFATLREVSPNKVYRAIFDVEERGKWETLLYDMRVFEKIDENTDMLYSAVRTPFPITDRDFCQLRTFAENYPRENSYAIHFTSTTHPLCPPLKNRVRAETVISGYVIQPSLTFTNSTDLTIIAQTDPKGNIPTPIVNHFAGKAPKEWVNKLLIACQKMK